METAENHPDSREPGRHRERERSILLVCSPGGHLLQMLALEPSWRDYEPTWVTLDSPDVGHLLAGYDVVYGHGPTNRSARNAIRNLILAWRVVRERDPDAILSTGAGLAPPFFLVGKALRRRTVFVESLTRISSWSLTGRLVYRLANEFFVQWPSAVRAPKMRFVGSIL